MERKTKFFIISICICLSLMLLSGTILILPTASWLQKETAVESSPSSMSVARAGVAVLNGSNEIVSNKTNVFDLNDIESWSLSQNYIYDVDTNANSCTVNFYGITLFDHDWIVTNLKANTTYTISYVMEMLDAVDSPSDTFKGIYLYSSNSPSTSVYLGYTTNTMVNGQSIAINRTFTTPSNLLDSSANFLIYIYSEYKKGSTKSYSTVRFHNLTLVESGDSSNQEYNTNMVLGTANTATTVNYKIKNTGNAQELIRVYYSIKDMDNEKVLTSTDVNVSINSDFIAHEKLDGVWAGYLYYNKALEANALVSVINSITPLSDYANKGVIVQIQVECVLYSGNAYSSGETTKYPWASVPSNWFVLK